jgi:hypothetical protein
MGRRKHSDLLLGWRSASGRLAPPPEEPTDADSDAAPSSSQPGPLMTATDSDGDTQMSFGNDFLGHLQDNYDN